MKILFKLTKERKCREIFLEIGGLFGGGISAKELEKGFCVKENNESFFGKLKRSVDKIINPNKVWCDKSLYFTEKDTGDERSDKSYIINGLNSNSIMFRDYDIDKLIISAENNSLCVLENKYISISMNEREKCFEIKLKEISDKKVFLLSSNIFLEKFKQYQKDGNSDEINRMETNPINY